MVKQDQPGTQSLGLRVIPDPLARLDHREQARLETPARQGRPARQVRQAPLATLASRATLDPQESAAARLVQQGRRATLA